MPEMIEKQLAALNRLYKEQGDIYHNLALRFELSDTAFWILYALCDTDKTYTQNDLCNAWFYPKQTINSAITKLINMDYVETEPLTGTHNSKAIKLTKEGKAFSQLKIVPVIEAEKKAFMQLTKEQREVFLSMLQQQIEILKEETKALS